MSNSNTLQSLFVSGLRGSFKSWFAFLIVGLLVFGAATSVADPSMNYYTANSNVPTVLLETYIDRDSTQFGLSVDNYESVDFYVYRLEFLVSNANNETYTSNYRSSDAEVIKTEVFSIHAPEFFRDIAFDDGTYQFVVESPVSTGLTFGQANYNTGAVILASIFLAISSMSLGIFFTILPFTFLVIIIKSLTGNKDVYTTPVKGKVRQPRVSTHVTRSRNPAFRDGFFSRFNEKDWTVLAFAIFFFFLSFAVPGGPFFFFFVIMTVGTLYNVTEREKLIDRLLVLLEHYPETNVEFLTTQLGEKSKKKVIKVLQIMILDDGLPIRLNLNNNTVRLVGPIPEHYRGVYSSPARPQTPVVPVSEKPRAPDIPPVAPVKPVEPKTPEILVGGHEVESEKYCTGCGEELITQVAYCYACGQKT